MRVVFVGGTFVADQEHFELLAARMEYFSVYGTTDTRGLDFVPTPPSGCEFRVFSARGWLRRGPVWWIFPGLRRALDEDRPDVVHVVSEPWGFLALQVCGWAKTRPHVRVVLHGCDRIWWHGSALERRLRRIAARRTLRVASAFAAESLEAIDRALEVGLRPDVPTAEIHTNPRNADLFVSATPEDRLAARSRLGLPPDTLIVGFLARLIPEKGVLVLVAAAKGFETSNLAPSFAIAGDGPLRSEVDSFAVDNPGIMVLGRLGYPKEVLDFYRAIDIFVIPSYTTAMSEEQSPRTVIEAMMSGCLVVGTTCGAIPLMLGEFGIVATERNAASLRDAISCAVDRIVSGHFWPEEARAYAVGRYSADATATRLESLWNRILDDPR